MRLKLGNEIPKISRSSKNVNFENIEEKIDNKKINPDRSFAFQSKISNQIASFSPKHNQFISYNNNLSLNEPYFNKAKRMLMNNASLIVPKTKTNNNFLHLNYLHNPKDTLNRSNISISNDFLKTKTRNSRQINGLVNSSKTNLKLVQKELQFKLLDMSMQMENLQSDDDESNYFSVIKNDKTESKLISQNAKQELEYN